MSNLKNILHQSIRFACFLLPVVFCLLIVTFITGCTASNHSFSPNKKYSPQQLQTDFAIYEQILEEVHPSLYWYSSKDSMDKYFQQGKEQLKDSLTEADFRKVLSAIVSKIGCGHTVVRPSKAYSKYRDTADVVKMFPLSLKLWKDTAVVTANLDRKDSALKRGTVITKINDQPVDDIAHRLFNYLPTDGYNTTHKYQVLSNRGSFGSLYSSLFGFPDKYSIEYIDSAGRLQTTFITPYYPATDTLTQNRIRSFQRQQPRSVRPSRKERRELKKNSARLLKIDTTEQVAMMDLNYFGNGYGLKKFFRRSFKALKDNQIKYLIIDVRNNGGGSPTNSTALTRYLIDHPFRISDSLYAITKRKKNSRYIKNDFFNRLFMVFFTKKKKDGYYHIGYFERHYFKPKKKNHFDGKTYILTGGNSFSATTLFVGAVIKLDNVTVAGEETGGGSYGNTAWHIPTVTLPETKVRFNLPLYRLVIDKNEPKTGAGVQPEVKAGPTTDAIRKGEDYKLNKVIELIKADKAASSRPSAEKATSAQTK